MGGVKVVWERCRERKRCWSEVWEEVRWLWRRGCAG